MLGGVAARQIAQKMTTGPIMAAGSAFGPVGIGVATFTVMSLFVLGIYLGVRSYKGKLVVQCECQNCQAHRIRRDGGNINLQTHQVGESSWDIIEDQDEVDDQDEVRLIDA